MTIGGEGRDVDSGSDHTRVAGRALWYVARGRAELRPAPLRSPGPDEALVRMEWSGISRGTERLVFSGHVPEGEFGRMRAPWQEGDFPFPVKYGYCAVGIVEEGPPPWRGRRVFVLHPHQDRFVVPIASLTELPPELPSRRAILGANMETALNGLWDAGCGPGDRIVVIGAGILGALAAALAARLPGAEVIIIDRDETRSAFAESLGAAFVHADQALDAIAREADVVFHASASAEGLALALALAGQEAAIVELSWYGDRAPAVPLGGAFHSRRLRIIASQVGAVAPSRRPRWTHARRLALALALLDDARLDALITEEVAFADVPAALPRLLAAGAPGIATAIRYADS